MKKILMTLVMVMMLALSACTEQTQYGKCIGISDEKDPNLVYKVDTKNAVLGILFFETIIVPINVVNDCLYCPYKQKQK